jgi:flagellar basal-body rod modification protein FlgD
MFDITRAMSTPTAIAPRYNNAVADPDAPVQAPAEPTPPPAAGTGKKNDALGRNEFLQLLVAQMKNQDPLNPMDGQEMAAQLAQFSQVEQLIDINSNMKVVAESQVELGYAIEDLSEITLAQGDAMAKLLEQSMAINTVGRTGVVAGDQVFVDREGEGSITVDTGEKEGIGRLTVIDSKGEAIGSYVIGDVTKGMQSFQLEDFGITPPLEPGQYSYRFDMADAQANWLPSKTYTSGRITGLRYEQGVPTLLLGDRMSVPFSALLQIRS